MTETDNQDVVPCYFCGVALPLGDVTHALVYESVDDGERIGGYQPICDRCQQEREIT